MCKKLYTICSVLGSLWFAFYPTVAEGSQKEQLLKVVVLSRHGVRSPIQSHKNLQQWTQKEWPYWPVERGALTPRGSVLVSALWEDLRDVLGLEELFPKNMCPDPSLIYVRANTLQRTQATAVALLNGFAPGCGLKYMIIDSQEWDPLFTPLETGSFSINVDKAIQEFNQRYGSVEKLRKELKEPLQLVASILGPCPDATCKEYGLASGCTILDIPDKIVLENSKNPKFLVGGLGFASTSVEMFLLQLGQWPHRNFSDINVSQDTLKKVMRIHGTVFGSVHHIPEMAVTKGSVMLKAIHDALTSTDSDPQVNKAKLVVLVGHDSNISSISGMLSLHWDIGGYGPDGTPPGGILVFTLWDTPKGKVVKAHYVCQSLETLTSPSIYPQKIVKEQLKLSSTLECSEKSFTEHVNHLINKKYLVKQKYSLKAKSAL